MRYLITKKSDGSIVASGYYKPEDDGPPQPVVKLLQRVGVKAVSLDMANGTRIRYEH